MSRRETGSGPSAPAAASRPMRPRLDRLALAVSVLLHVLLVLAWSPQKVALAPEKVMQVVVLPPPPMPQTAPARQAPPPRESPRPLSPRRPPASVTVPLPEMTEAPAETAPAQPVAASPRLDSLVAAQRALPSLARAASPDTSPAPSGPAASAPVNTPAAPPVALAASASPRAALAGGPASARDGAAEPASPRSTTPMMPAPARLDPSVAAHRAFLPVTRADTPDASPVPSNPTMNLVPAPRPAILAATARTAVAGGPGPLRDTAAEAAPVPPTRPAGPASSPPATLARSASFPLPARPVPPVPTGPAAAGQVPEDAVAAAPQAVSPPARLAAAARPGRPALPGAGAMSAPGIALATAAIAPVPAPSVAPTGLAVADARPAGPMRSSTLSDRPGDLRPPAAPSPAEAVPMPVPTLWGGAMPGRLRPQEGEGDGILAAPDYADGNPEFIYPPRAVRLGLEGTVLLDVEVLPDGRPGDIRLKQGSGHALLDRDAIQQMARWRFKPARRGGRVEPIRAIIPVQYRLDTKG